MLHVEGVLVGSEACPRVDLAVVEDDLSLDSGSTGEYQQPVSQRLDSIGTIAIVYGRFASVFYASRVDVCPCNLRSTAR